MIASLPMYDHPELFGATNRYWKLIRTALVAKGFDAPSTLTRDGGNYAIWTSPELVLSQTCGLPYRTTLHDKVSLIGTPDMGVSGCPEGYYRSAFVIRDSESRSEVEDFFSSVLVINSHDSQSGYAALRQHIPESVDWFSQIKVSGSHACSARMVATGDADLASIDAVTWRLIQQYEDFAHQLKVLSWSQPTPGLPYICSPTFNANTIYSAVQEAISRLSAIDQAMLGVRGIVSITPQTYLNVDD